MKNSVCENETPLPLLCLPCFQNRLLIICENSDCHIFSLSRKTRHSLARSSLPAPAWMWQLSRLLEIGKENPIPQSKPSITDATREWSAADCCCPLKLINSWCPALSANMRHPAGLLPPDCLSCEWKHEYHHLIHMAYEIFEELSDILKYSRRISPLRVLQRGHFSFFLF